MANSFDKTQKIPKGFKVHVKLFVIPKDGAFLVTDSTGKQGFLYLIRSLQELEKRVKEEIESKGVEVRFFLQTA
jgi:hypothetical protein